MNDPLDLLAGDLESAARFVYGKAPTQGIVHQFPRAYPLKAARIKDVRVFDARFSRIPASIGPAVAHIIDHTAFNDVPGPRIISTGTADCAIEVFSLFCVEAAEVYCWLHIDHHWRAPLIDAMRPASAPKLEYDYNAMLRQFPEDRFIENLGELPGWSTTHQNVVALALYEEFHGIRGLIDIRRLLDAVDSMGWQPLLRSLGDRLQVWHGVRELDRLQMPGAWERPRELVAHLQLALRGDHPEMPRPDVWIHDSGHTPVPAEDLAEGIRLCTPDCRYIGIIRGTEHVDALKSACKAAKTPVFVLQEPLRQRPNPVSDLFLASNLRFARPNRRKSS